MMPPLPRPAILIVDDHPANLVAMKAVLATLDADLHTAVSGREALLLCMEYDFAVILLDVQMPAMDGYEVARLLRGAEKTAGVPILFLTAVYADEGHALQGYEIGAVDFIFKPVNDRILLSKIAVFLELHRQRQYLEWQTGQIRQHSRQVEKALAEQRLSDARSRLVLEEMPVLIVALDQEETILAWNHACERATGYCAREVIGNPKVLELLYPDPVLRQRMLQAWRGQAQAGHGGSENWQTQRKDGSSCIILWFNIAAGHPVPGWTFWSIGLDVTEQVRMEEEILRSREALRHLADHIQQAREEERQWIAREVHDELGGHLTRLKLDLLHLSLHVPGQSQEDRQRFQEALSLVEETLQTARNVSQRLRPTILDQFGLLAGLEWLAREYGKSSGIPCAVHAHSANLRLDAKRENALFRICQEGLTNMVRHSGATRALVELGCDARQVVMTISDNGEGVNPGDPQEPGRSLGLLGMSERARHLGGELRLATRPEGGTALTVTLPRLPEDILEEP